MSGMEMYYCYDCCCDCVEKVDYSEKELIWNNITDYSEKVEF